MINVTTMANLLDNQFIKNDVKTHPSRETHVNNEDWQLVQMNLSHEEVLQKLNLIPKSKEPPKKTPRRQKGSKKQAKNPTFDSGR